MRVLSVDFDYFQTTTKKLTKLYPDGVDLPTDLSEAEWGKRYAVDSQHLLKIGINHPEFSLIKTILKRQNKNVPVKIAQSHKDIYSFIKDRYNFSEELRLVNVDFHHDFFNKNEEVDCGNWVGHILEEVRAAGQRYNFDWIANPLSDKIYQFGDELAPLILTSLQSIINEEFDLIFLCRSDNWLPPHLDTHFTALCEIITDSFNSVEYEEEVMFPRRCYEEIAESIRCFVA